MTNRLPEDDVRRAMGLLVPAIRLPEDYARLDHFRKLAREGVAGFLLFGGDEELVPPFLASLRQAAEQGGGGPLLVMTDAERGVGQQVSGCVDLPPLLAVGATLSEERAYHHGRVTALEARALGINVVLAPVVDVLSLPSNPIMGNRSFGAGPELVGRLGAAWITGAQEQGVLACAKHFPGHGHTAGDSHAELPSVGADLATLRRRELPPFQAAIAAGVGSVMTAHVRYPALDPDAPATLSPKILRDLLRGELGFGGLVISDALIMEGLLVGGEAGARLDEAEAAVRCVAAGCDILLYPTDPHAVAKALARAHAAGRIELGTILARIRLALSDLAVDSRDPQQLRAEHLWGSYALARDSLTVLANVAVSPASGARLLPLQEARRRHVMAVLVDDDDDAGRERVFRERKADFAAGFVRVTGWEGGGDDPSRDPLLSAVDEADTVILVVASSIRAWKGRATLSPGLSRLVTAILGRAGSKTVTVLLAAPGVLGSVDAAPAALVGAWGDAEVTIRAALDVILSGGFIRGLDPTVGGAER